MIISASYKTDIPAFYGEWFMRRLRAGYCMMTQPYNRRSIRVSLNSDDVDGFVFWTKNIGPFMKYLPDIRRFDRPFVVQYTINGYPRQLESAVISPSYSITHMHRLAAEFGPRIGVWRYDPILISSLTDADFHRDNFISLAGKLRGATNEVVISFAHFYRKTLVNLRRATPHEEFSWQDPAKQIKRNLSQEFAQIASDNGMRLSICSQPDYQGGSACAARCIDADRLASISGRPINVKIAGNRPGCLCHSSRDIGEYDTCPHGCVYCYAVQKHQTATERFRKHDPACEYLHPPAMQSV